MTIKPLIIFPFGGYQNNLERKNNLQKIVNICQDTVPDEPPIIIINRDTLNNKKTATNLEDIEQLNVKIKTVWSVDTCQMWLAGWGYIIDKIIQDYEHKNNIIFSELGKPEQKSILDQFRIVQIAGDLDFIENPNHFFNHIKNLIDCGNSDIYIGDFESSKKFSAKDLIDLFGTIPLLANWFPEISTWIQKISIQKPRSEFLNIKVGVMWELLKKRKFAYEQTLNMIIRSWDFKLSKPKYDIRPVSLGKIGDDKSYRKYRECLDQIERTERMLRLLWREIKEPKLDEFESFLKFIDKYDFLDQRSTAIRETARITIRSLLNS